jgi:hypothetical protein
MYSMSKAWAYPCLVVPFLGLSEGQLLHLVLLKILRSPLFLYEGGFRGWGDIVTGSQGTLLVPIQVQWPPPHDLKVYFIAQAIFECMYFKGKKPWSLRNNICD